MPGIVNAVLLMRREFVNLGIEPEDIHVVLSPRDFFRLSYVMAEEHRDTYGRLGQIGGKEIRILNFRFTASNDNPEHEYEVLPGSANPETVNKHRTGRRKCTIKK